MSEYQLNNQKYIVCSHCGYDTNPTAATNCLKCNQSLLQISLPRNSNGTIKPKTKSSSDWLFAPWMVKLVFALLFLFLSWAVYSLFRTVGSQNTTIGTGAYDTSNSSQNISPETKLYNSMKDVPNVPSGTFNYGGGATFAALTAQGLNDAMNKAHPNFRLRYVQPRDNQPGGRTGVSMLLNSRLSLTLQGAPLTDADYNQAEQRGFQLKQVPVALDALVFFTHPDVSIPGLSVQQLKDIYKGKLTNWKQVGGRDLPIVAFTRNPQDSTLLNEFLGSRAEQVGSKVQFVLNYTDAIRKVASTPGGIAFGGAGPIIAQQTIRPLAVAIGNSQEYVQPFINNGQEINAPAVRDGSYPVTRRMFIVIRQDGTIDDLAGNAFINMLLSKEGQQIVEKAGLVPIRGD